MAFLPFLDCIFTSACYPVTFGKIVRFMTTRYPLREQLKARRLQGSLSTVAGCKDHGVFLGVQVTIGVQ